MTDDARIIRVRSVDFHERNNWAVVWVLLNEYDEAFVYREYNPSPIKVTSDVICDEIADMSLGESYKFNLIDPLAKKNQTNSRTSALDDINRRFRELRQRGESCRTIFEPFDTKGTHGRDAIRIRLHNAVTCKTPGNNLIKDDHTERRLPTLWIDRDCRLTILSIKNWRYEEWTGNSAAYKDRKESPIQKYSHFCTALEGIFKDIRFKVPRISRGYRPPRYFKREG